MDSQSDMPIGLDDTQPAEQNCPHCKARAEEDTQNEEMSLAFLLALTPLVALTFFGQVGLL